MNDQRIISALEEILPSVKETGRPEPVLLKYASDNNLSPAQLEKMAHKFNIAKSLTYFDKAPNRGGTFSLIDPQELVREYTSYTPKQASTGMHKAAATSTGFNKFPGKSVLDAYTELDKVAAESCDSKELSDKEKRKLKKTEIEQAKSAAGFADEAMDFFKTQIKEAKAKLDKMFMSIYEPLSKQTFIDDVMYTFGKEAGELVIKQLVNQEFTAESYSSDLTKLAFDLDLRRNANRIAALDTAAETYENMKGFSGAKSIKEAFEKEALTAAEIKKIQTEVEKKRYRQQLEESVFPKPTPKDIAKQDYELERYKKDIRPSYASLQYNPTPRNLEPVLKGLESGGAKIVSVLDSIKPLAPLHTLKNVTQDFAPSYNKSQEGVDSAREEIARAATLARLMQSDPIISEADPDKVNEIYNDIQAANPEFVRDPMRLRMILREAIQYDAVPLHTFKELTDIRKVTAEAKDKENKLSDKKDVYKINKSDYTKERR